ncbi:MAG: hypothetical protein ACQEVT_12165 [Pseudomonadota bacterium]|uniref:hypothetical protein n=1 Tax=Roseovarius sp. TaxID=1486281 RepID=UPI003565FEBB
MSRTKPHLLPLLAALLFLAGCNTPGPGFRGLDPQRVSIGKSTFDVRVDAQARRAQAIRVNSEWAPGRRSVQQRAATAIQQVSGCRVSRLEGDQVVIVARLDCGKGAALRVPVPQTLEYDCNVAPRGEGRARMTCTPLN